MEYEVKVTLTFHVMAENADLAKEIAREGMQEVNDSLADIHVTEWSEPEISA